MSNQSKIVIISTHREAVYQYALAFVNTAEPTPRGGLARAYYSKAGVRLETLDEVTRAILAAELMVSITPAATI